MPMGARAGLGSDSPNPIHVAYDSKTHVTERSSSKALSFSPSLSPTSRQSALAIFVPHCDYMLTDHLHGYQHLCRYIDEAWVCWSVFLFSQIALRPGTASAFISSLSSSPAVTSWPPDRLAPPEHEPQIANSSRWLSSSGSSRTESCCVTSLSSSGTHHARSKVLLIFFFNDKPFR